MSKLFVYGTLRYNAKANHLLNGSDLLDKEVKATGYSLYDYHGLYPFAVKSLLSKDFILGDIYDVSNEILNMLDKYEGDLYHRFWDEENKFFIYLKKDKITSGYYKITSGNWISYKHKLSN